MSKLCKIKIKIKKEIRVDLYGLKKIKVGDKLRCIKTHYWGYGECMDNEEPFEKNKIYRVASSNSLDREVIWLAGKFSCRPDYFTLINSYE